MKIALVTGPGGAGSTTISALIAVALARTGSPTVLISSDCSLPAVLADPAPEGRPWLTVLRPDPAARATDAWPSIAGYLSALGVGQDIEPAELAGVPGALAVATLLEIGAAADAGNCDTMVVDAGSSAVDLLAAPESIGNLTDRLLPAPLRILRQLGGLRAGTAPPGDVGPVDLIGELLGRLLLAHTLLTAPDITSVQMVVGPEPLRRAAAIRLVPALAVCGAGIGRVVLNRRRPMTDPELATEQAYWPAELLVVPDQPTEPVGAALDTLVDAIHHIGDLPLPAGIGPAVTELRVSKEESGFRTEIPVPLAERASLHLARSGDDLLISVAGHTRRVELPPVLQRCTIAGAEFVGAAEGRSPDAALHVRFVPDLDRWPQGLASGAAGPGAGGAAAAAAAGAAADGASAGAVAGAAT